jgi:putative Holliday junction resolvase
VQRKPDAIVLAFDFGTRRIGVAIGNTLTGRARPLTTLDSLPAPSLLDRIATLVESWRPTQLVVGLPVHADGTPHAMTSRARRFASELERRFGLPVALVDERWTTQVAGDSLRGAGRTGRAERDETAAAIILQAWLDERHEN